jgi:hypothetical protein
LIPGRSKIFLFSKIFVPVLRPTQPHLLSSELKEANRSPRSTAAVRNKNSQTSVPSPCLHVLHGDNFTFYIIGYRVATGVSECLILTNYITCIIDMQIMSLLCGGVDGNCQTQKSSLVFAVYY